MNDINILETSEYSSDFSGDTPKLPDDAENWWHRPKGKITAIDVAARLGLHIENKKPKTGDYVGLVWWPDPKDKEGQKSQKSNTALCVTPKFENMDYLAMYLECLKDPVVGPHMDKCFFFWPKKPLIEIPLKEVPLEQASAPFAAMAFVKELHEMVRRNMRKNFLQKEENLTGRFKGRLLMGQHIRKNLLAGRPDRNYCQYGVISEDCRENQILLAALERCARLLMSDERAKKNAKLMSMVRMCRTALQGVTLRRHIHERDFAGIRYTGTFVHYKRPHALARMILNHKELDPSAKSPDKEGETNKTVKVVPFALCTSELFERYCEVQLRNVPNLKTWAGSENLGREYPYRPDFLSAESITTTHWILDAKYYRSYQKHDRKISEDNIQQLLKYSQHKPVRDKMQSLIQRGDITDLRLAILYPSLTAAKIESQKDKGKGKEFKLEMEEDNGKYKEFILRLGFIPVYVPLNQKG